ncbi:MAG: glycosyltransferase family 39 protein [Candidatus Omnitrophica bacterium]|nr:glycosyltransferase family 39 protein [Candidatus Omnitrophota bacterium]MCM8801889.1 glycosyltransferase family 39 protein [Candidatus Omnitrophota bacterium]
MVKPSTLFNKILFSTLILKIFFSFFFPLTGDEAYFITTGQKFYLGYYEHPPMIWWLIYLFSFFGRKIHHFFFYRLISVFATTLVAFLIFKLLEKIDKEKSFLVSSLFLLSPIHIFGILITNDTPLFLFTFLSGIFFYRGIKRDKKIDFITSGIFFGLSFLSKYFSVLYLLSIFIYIIYRREKKLWRNFVLFLIASFPFVFINLYWNYTHCWINIIFNLVHRKKNQFLHIKNISLFWLSLLFLLTPYPFYLFLKEKFFFKFRNEYDLFYFMFVLPTIFLFLISLIRIVGLHWFISFIPFYFFLLISLEKEKIIKSIKTAFYFNGFITTIIILLLIIPVGKFKDHPKYSEILMFKNPDSLCSYLKDFKDRYIFATPNYTYTAIMTYHCKINFIVFADLGHSGREYDISFDFKEIDGRDILIFTLENISPEDYIQFFEEIKKEKIIVKGANYYLLLCKKFNYENYKNIILKKTYEKFYKVPEFLPRKGDFFKEKYNLLPD